MSMEKRGNIHWHIVICDFEALLLLAAAAAKSLQSCYCLGP